MKVPEIKNSQAIMQNLECLLELVKHFSLQTETDTCKCVVRKITSGKLELLTPY